MCVCAGYTSTEIPSQRSLLYSMVAAELVILVYALVAIFFTTFTFILCIFGSTSLYSELCNQKLQLSPDYFAIRERLFQLIGSLSFLTGVLLGVLVMVFFMLFEMSIIQNYDPSSPFHFTFIFYFSLVLFSFYL